MPFGGAEREPVIKLLITFLEPNNLFEFVFSNSPR
jgi:hypothetical protein